MKKSKRQRERSEDRRASAVDRAERQRSGMRPYLDIPKGVKMFALDKEGPIRRNVLEYRVGKNNPNAEKGDRFYERTFWIHRGIGPDNDSHLCPAKCFGKKCPVCKHRAKLKRDPDVDKDELKALNPSERQLFFVGNPKKLSIKGVEVMDISNFWFGKELDVAVKKLRKKLPKKKVDKFASSTDGMTCLIEVEEGSYNKKPTFSAKYIKLVPRKEQYDKDLVDVLPCLDDMLKETPYKKLNELFLQSRDEDDDDEDEDEDDDDDLDDDEDDEDDDEDEEDDEDEDDSDDDDDDEDEDDDDEDDDDSDDDEDEDEDEDDDDDSELEAKKGDNVKFTYKGKKLKGVVKRLKGELAYVKCKGRSDPYIQHVEDLKVLGDDEPKSKKKKRKKVRS